VASSGAAKARTPAAFLEAPADEAGVEVPSPEFIFHGTHKNSRKPLAFVTCSFSILKMAHKVRLAISVEAIHVCRRAL